MGGKTAIGMILQTSPFWGIAINVLIAIIAAKEAVRGKFPTKTIIAVCAFAGLLTVLAVIYTALP